MAEETMHSAPSRPKTRLSKSGQPVQGTYLDVQLTETDDAGGHLYETARVVGKLYGRGGNSDLVGVILEWEDGTRQPAPWPDLIWRACA